MPARPKTTGPATEVLTPQADAADPQTPPAEPVDGLTDLRVALDAVNGAVDDMIAQHMHDGSVTRVGVAQLRDAIDALRQSIPRQTSKRRV